jgi:hypothetical protein
MNVPLRVRQLLIPATAAAIGLSLAGCALSTSELRDAAAAPQVLSNTSPASAVSATPAVLVEQAPAESSRAVAKADALPPLPKGPMDPRQTGSIPSGGQQPAAKLMSPAEKARVIAELEALARGQSVAPPPPPRPAFCADPEAKLDPAQRLACDPNAPRPALRP